MAEIVKVQRPLMSNDSRAPWLIYNAKRRHVTEVPGAAIPSHVKKAMGDDFKAYFKGTWSGVVGYQPRLLGEAEAAAYIGISATNLRGLGLPRRVLGDRKLYDRLDLDAFAAALPYEGQDVTQVNEGAGDWDRAYGITR